MDRFNLESLSNSPFLNGKIVIRKYAAYALFRKYVNCFLVRNSFTSFKRWGLTRRANVFISFELSPNFLEGLTRKFAPHQPLNTDPSKTTVNRINKKLTTLRNQKKLSKHIHDQIRPNDATIAKFYGLPKIHKGNNPLRPVVSLPGSRTNKLSKYPIADILKPLINKSPHSVKNLNSFLSKLEDIRVEPDEIIFPSTLSLYLLLFHLTQHDI